jgi:hypothetical protein
MGSALKDLIAREAQEDPLLKFLNNKLGFDAHWRKYFFVLLLIAFGFFVKFRLDQAYERSVAEASDLLWRVQQTYTSLNEENITNREELEESMRNFIGALAQQRDVFPQLGTYYQALSLHQAGNSKQALELLPTANAWLSVSESKTEDRLLAELAAMLRSKILLSLEDSNGELRKQALAELGELSRSAYFLAKPAELSLARIADLPAALEIANVEEGGVTPSEAQVVEP